MTKVGKDVEKLGLCTWWQHAAAVESNMGVPQNQT
jgi:hypothetical protein